jgi:homoserine kinase type II
VADKNGSYLQEYEKKAVSIYRHLAGKDFSAATLTTDHIEKIGQTLARLHLIGQEYDTPIRNRFAFDRVRSIYQSLRGRIAVHLKHIGHVLDDEIAHQEEYREEKLPKGMIHGDLFPDNVLFRGGRVVGVLDFEAACFGKFIADLATAVNAMCYHEERYHIGRFNALLDGYQSERTLSLAEWDAFPNELRFSAFRFTLTRLRDFFFRHMDEKRRVNKDYREFFHRLRILRRERSGGMDQMLLTMATGYDYRKYQKIHAEEKGVNA